MPPEKTKNEQQQSDERQTSEAQDFELLSEDQKSASVYDFLYQDVRRVGSYLAQFDEYGVRQTVKATEAAGRTQAVKGAASGTIGIPAVMGGSANVDVTTTDETKDLAEHTFDPLWSNSRRLLDYLAEHDLINDDLWNAYVGQFVLIEGSISIIDIHTLATALDDPEITNALILQACAANNFDPFSEQAAEIRRNLSIALRMPMGIHLYIYKHNSNAWATLSPESLVTNCADIALKHGALIRGEWFVLGVLDALPDFRNAPTEENPEPPTLDELGAIFLEDGLIKVAANLTNVTRNILGRPRHMFGVTPILIFRKVSGRGRETTEGANQ